jgi:hypothetical protein
MGRWRPQILREIGFPWSEAMAERARVRSVGDHRPAVPHSGRVAANIAGGTHHAYADKGGGFCVFNDAAVAARLMQAEAGAGRGPGPLEGGRDRPGCAPGQRHGPFSAGRPQRVHAVPAWQKNFPFRKEASDLDVDLPDGCRR